MAQGDAQRYAQIASLAGFTVVLLCLALRLSALVKLISDSILVGFKAGAGLTLAMTQLPSLFAVPCGGQNFFERAWLFVGQLGQTRPLVLAVGGAAIVLLIIGERECAYDEAIDRSRTPAALIGAGKGPVSSSYGDSPQLAQHCSTCTGGRNRGSG